MTPRSLVAAAALATLAWPGAALAKEFTPQNNELAFDVDASFAKKGANQSDLSIKYTWIPGALDQNDEVVPVLRRFVRQPGELSLRLTRSGDLTDAITGLYASGTGWLPGARFYGTLDLGLEYDQVLNEPTVAEDAFVAAHARAEAGVRLLPLLQLGGFFRYRPVILTMPRVNSANASAERSGATSDAGVSLGLATPDDRLLFDASVGRRWVDWSFDGGIFDGDVTGRALFARLRASLQLSPTQSVFLRGEVTSTDWVNRRAGADVATGRSSEGTVLDLRADLGYLYWFEGHWGFRISLGGGYFGEGPLFGQDFESGLFRLGVGLTSRY